MKITLKRTDEQVELVKAMASKNRDVAYEAQVALAEFIGPVLAKVINQAPTLSNLFSNFSFSTDESPSIPMDLYYDITDEDYVTVWSQAVPGGLPTNTVTPIGGEMKFTTYRLIVLLTSTSVMLNALVWMLLVSLSLGLLKKYF